MNKNEIREGFTPEIKYIVKTGFMSFLILIFAFFVGMFVVSGNLNKQVLPISFLITSLIVLPIAAAW